MEFNVNIKGLSETRNKLKTIKDQLAKVPEEAYKVFKENTPRRSGNARRNTKLKDKKTIHANYPYAQRLDDGYSKQYPQGMTKPTEKFIRNRIQKIVRGR